jgi:inosine-uridine nucleoside N-ribohydrolase
MQSASHPKSSSAHFLLAIAALAITANVGQLRAADAASQRKPVILDSDIGDDIDDTWALGLLLKSPELDLKLVVGDYGKSAYRAKIFAKFLQAAGRTDVGVGLGVRQNADAVGPQADWVKDYDLKSYPGKVHEDGVQALIDTILASPQRITLIAIGPLPNIAEALKREPRIAEKADFVGMHGSVRKGYDGSSTISPEWNVKADAKSCAAVFKAPWNMTITPLDTCGVIVLDGQRYATVRDSKDPIASAIIANYRIWSTDKDKKNDAAEHRSSVLFDTVAVYLAVSHDLCKMEKLGIRVTDDGFTRIDPAAKQIEVATEWKDLDAYRDLLVKRLTGAAN